MREGEDMTAVSLNERRLQSRITELEATIARLSCLRAVLHLSEDREPSIFVDEGITVYWVDEAVPHDRIFRAEPHPIPEGMLVGPVGEIDLTEADIEAAHRAADAIGKPRLHVVGTGDPQDVPVSAVRGAISAMSAALAQHEEAVEKLRADIARLQAQYGGVL